MICRIESAAALVMLDRIGGRRIHFARSGYSLSGHTCGQEILCAARQSFGIACDQLIGRFRPLFPRHCWKRR